MPLRAHHRKPAVPPPSRLQHVHKKQIYKTNPFPHNHVSNQLLALWKSCREQDEPDRTRPSALPAARPPVHRPLSPVFVRADAGHGGKRVQAALSTRCARDRVAWPRFRRRLHGGAPGAPRRGPARILHEQSAAARDRAASTQVALDRRPCKNRGQTATFRVRESVVFSELGARKVVSGPGFCVRQPLFACASPLSSASSESEKWCLAHDCPGKLARDGRMCMA